MYQITTMLEEIIAVNKRNNIKMERYIKEIKKIDTQLRSFGVMSKIDTDMDMKIYKDDIANEKAKKK